MPNKTKRRYFEWNYDTGVVSEFERMGECNGCGQCCMAYIAYEALPSIARRKDGKLTGGRVGDSTDQQGIWFEVNEGKHRFFIKPREITVGKQRCPSLTENLKCTMHTLKNAKKDSLAVCDVWPMHPDQVRPFDQCSYTFKKINESKF